MAIALIVAAGRGERLGAECPKALVELGGAPLLQWSVQALSRVASISEIIVALPAGAQAPAGTVGVRGGAVRSESVRCALAAAGPGDPVLIHDAARPLLTVALVEEVLAACRREGVDGAVAASPLTDTVKRAGLDGSVSETLDRSSLWAVQTPQVFGRSILERALEVSEEVLAMASDDAWLVERAGGNVVIVEAPPENLKITTTIDLALAEMLLARRPA